MFASKDVDEIASVFTQVAVMSDLPLCLDFHKRGIHLSQSFA